MPATFPEPPNVGAAVLAGTAGNDAVHVGSIGAFALDGGDGSLEAQGGSALTDYIGSHGYLDFTAANKVLGPGVGFWVNKP